jgi:hypothetical protein
MHEERNSRSKSVGSGGHPTKRAIAWPSTQSSAEYLRKKGGGGLDGKVGHLGRRNHVRPPRVTSEEAVLLTTGPVNGRPFFSASKLHAQRHGFATTAITQTLRNHQKSLSTMVSLPNRCAVSMLTCSMHSSLWEFSMQLLASQCWWSSRTARTSTAT